jgi:hypothetical protein
MRGFFPPATDATKLHGITFVNIIIVIFLEDSASLVYYYTIRFSRFFGFCNNISFLLNKVVSLASNLQPGGPSPCIYIPEEQGGPVIRQALGFLFVAFYDSQGYDGGIRTCLHTKEFTTTDFRLNIQEVDSPSLGDLLRLSLGTDTNQP